MPSTITIALILRAGPDACPVSWGLPGGEVESVRTLPAIAEQSAHRSVWTIAERQHGVVTRAQLFALGYRPSAINHRMASGRLHPVWRGVYAVGRPELTRHGRFMAAVLG